MGLLMALHQDLNGMINAMLPIVKQFHGKSQLAPHAASITNDGQVRGSALVKTRKQNIGVSEAVNYFEEEFRKAAEAGTIIASAIFFHGLLMIQPGAHPAVAAHPAETNKDARSVIALLEHNTGESLYLVIPYKSTPNGIEYELGRLIAKPPRVFKSVAAARKSWWRFW